MSDIADQRSEIATSSTPFAEELDLAHRCAARAAEIMVRREGVDQVREKGRADLVTKADEAAEAAIKEIIAGAFPSDRIIAEESSAGEDPGQGRRWIVDPIDGTVNFVHGHPFACVSVAFADNDGLAVGVINAPFLGEVYHAVRGQGAFLNGEPISVSKVSDSRACLLATGFPFKGNKGDPGVYFEMVAELVQQTHGVRRAGAAALDLAFVACGRVDAYFEVGLSPWDVAAGMLLVAEAGGTVTGWQGDEEAPLLTGRVIASNGRVGEWLAEATGRYTPWV